MPFWQRKPAPVTESVTDAPANVVRRGFEVDVPLGGTTGPKGRGVARTRHEDMDELYRAYLSCPWSSTCIDTIARLVTAGGLRIVPDDGSEPDGAKPAPVQAMERFLRFCNPREDAVQLLRSSVVDLLVFGDAFVELRLLLGQPAGMWTLDSTTVQVQADEHGEVAGYEQQVDAQRVAEFTPAEVIHVSLDAPRGGLYGISPTRKLLLSITSWLFTEACIKENFRRGDPPEIAVDLGRGTPDADADRWRMKYQTGRLGPRSIGQPIITRTLAMPGAPPVKELQARKVENYLAAARQLRDEIISGYGMSPAMIGVIESGNLGGGTGESQARALHYNTVVPLQNLLLEKFNFRLLPLFGITGWHLEFAEVDYRDSETVEKIRDTRLRDGAYTLNRYRAEIGEPPVDGGDDPVLVDRQNLVLWADMADLSASIVAKNTGAAQAIADPNGTAPTADDAPGGQGDAEPGEPPRESRGPARDQRALSEAWRKAYQHRRKQALKELP